MDKGYNNWGWQKGAIIRFNRQGVDIRFDKGVSLNKKDVII